MQLEQTTSAAEAHNSDVCPNCGREFLGDFCYVCGERKHHPEDLTFRHFLMHATHDLTHLDAKIFSTLRYLFTRPGFLTQEYLAGRHSRYMKPFSLFLVACAIFFLVDSIKPIAGYNVEQITAQDKTGRLESAWEKLARSKHVPREIIIERVQSTMHRTETAAQLFSVLAMAAVLALMFRGRYFVEHLVFSLHFLSFLRLSAVILAPAITITSLLSARGAITVLMVALIGIPYLFISMRRVYGQGPVKTFFKALVSYVITRLVTILVLGVVWILAVLRATMAK